MDRHAIIEAYYWYYTHNYDGQRSPEYARLCRLSRIFRPGPCSNGPSDESAQMIYDDLVAQGHRAPLRG